MLTSATFVQLNGWMNITHSVNSLTQLGATLHTASAKSNVALSSQPFMQALSDAISGTLQKFGIDPSSVTLDLGATRSDLGAATRPDSATSQNNAAGPTVALLPNNLIGFNALIPRSNPASAIASAPITPAPASILPTQHFYASDAVDDLYWSKQPPVVQQLREIDDIGQREALGSKLASQGYQIDVPVMVWGWDAGKTTELRKAFGYTWVPSATQQPIAAAPGLTGAGMTPYDPANPPVGSIAV